MSLIGECYSPSQFVFYYLLSNYPLASVPSKKSIFFHFLEKQERYFEFKSNDVLISIPVLFNIKQYNIFYDLWKNFGGGFYENF